MRVYLDCESKSSSSLKKKSMTKKVLSWNKIDLEKYSKELKNSLPTHTSGFEVESNVVALMRCLTAASKIAVPSKTVKLKGPKKQASQKLLDCPEK